MFSNLLNVNIPINGVGAGDSWSVAAFDGIAPTTTTYSPAAGSLRLAVVIVSCEDWDTVQDVTSVTLGGQAVTKLQEAYVTSGGQVNLVWLGYLNEAGIVAMVGTTLVANWGAQGQPNNGTKIAYASYTNVNQSSPIADSSINTSVSTTQLSYGEGKFTQNEGEQLIYASAIQFTTGIGHPGAATEVFENSDHDHTLSGAIKTSQDASGDPWEGTPWSSPAQSQRMITVGAVITNND